MKCPNCLKNNIETNKSWYMSFNKCLDCKYEWEANREKKNEKT